MPTTANQSSSTQSNVDKINPNTIEIVLKEMLKSKILKEANISSKIFFVFIFIGIFIKIIFGNMDIYDPIHGAYGDASITIWSYGLIMFSIICIILLNVIINADEDNIMKIFSFDMVVLIIYILWIITINMKHFKKINKKKIPDHYNLYATLSLFVILFQTMFFLVNYMIKNGSSSNNNSFIQQNKDLFKKIDFINHLLMVLNFILIMIQQIILDNFSVDVL